MCSACVASVPIQWFQIKIYIPMPCLSIKEIKSASVRRFGGLTIYHKDILLDFLPCRGDGPLFKTFCAKSKQIKLFLVLCVPMYYLYFVGNENTHHPNYYLVLAIELNLIVSKGTGRHLLLSTLRQLDFLGNAHRVHYKELHQITLLGTLFVNALFDNELLIALCTDDLVISDNVALEQSIIIQT
ncbi:hypothetical protein AGLY_006610 [Aphis glycines]|uniref:Uncharacterized protein n=1 Tax=Aphis glycines TaxID=307491 RepID=A0A6G0TRK2_APHGL|nr:hypothetical protein AGLY_006610 [Aphis glycines]